MKPLNKYLRLLPKESKDLEEVELGLEVFGQHSSKKTSTEPDYSTYRLADSADNCEQVFHVNVLVDNRMVEKIEVDGETFHFVKEQYVIATFR